MLRITDLHVSIKDDKGQQKPIIRGLNLTVPKGEVHVIMGPNGSGKSTLANVLAGRDEYHISSGNIVFNDANLLELKPEERAALGLFLAFQYPTEIPGVNNIYFLRTALNSIRKQSGLPPFDAADFLFLVKSKMKEVGLDDSFLHRAVNDGFSGGEKKRNEILQMLVLEPKFLILDETDSGLDIDALHKLANCVNKMRSSDRGILIVTHYQRLLDFIEPNVVHVMAQGKILKSGDRSVALEVEEKGYSWVNNESKHD